MYRVSIDAASVGRVGEKVVKENFISDPSSSVMNHTSGIKACVAAPEVFVARCLQNSCTWPTASPSQKR